MKVINATVVYNPEIFHGQYGESLSFKARLDGGDEKYVRTKNLDDPQFSALKGGDKIQLIEDSKNGKTFYKLVDRDISGMVPATLAGNQSQRSPQRKGVSSSSPSPILTASDRLNQLLDCFAEILIRVENRFPNREPEDQRAIATTMLIQLQREYGEKLALAAQAILSENFANTPQAKSPVVRQADPNKPWKQWKSPNDAIVWAQGELPSWDIDDLKIAFGELPGKDGKKADQWVDWVTKRRDVFGCEGDNTWF